MDKENLSTAKDDVRLLDKFVQNSETTVVYPCPKCGSKMAGDRAMCGICLFYSINADISGYI